MPSLLDRALRPLARRGFIAKAAPDFQQAMLGGANNTSQAAITAEMARLNRDFGATGKDGVQFGPGVPPTPQPLDQSGQPRQYPYRVGWNIPSLPGEGRPLSMATLEQLASTWWVFSKGIEIRCDEVCSLRFDLIARDTDRRRARVIVQDQQDQIKRIRDFFVTPDPYEGRSWQAWLRAILWDHFVLDGVCLWKQRTLGGKLYGLRPIKASTIKPLISVQGTRPKPPDPAYQEYLYGVARDSFDTHELVYAVKNRRLDTPYGFSAVEKFMWQVNQALRYDRAILDFWTDGTLPEGVAVAPPDHTPAQLAELREWWDGLMAGDTRQLHKLQWVPFGTAFHEFKTFDGFNEPFARWLVDIGCAALDVTSTELGFAPQHGGLGGKGFAEEQSTVLKRKSIKPLTRWLCDEIFNPIIWEEFGATALQATFADEGDEEDRLQSMQARDLAIRNGSMSIDQAVEEDGGEPPGIGRVFVFGNAVYFEPDLVLGTEKGVNALTPPPVPPPGPDGTSPSPHSGAEQMQAEQAQDARQAKQEEGQPPARQQQSAASKAATDELGRFLRYAARRQRLGKWADFESSVLVPGTLSALNTAAKAGADADALRAIVGLSDQPAHFRERVAAAEGRYRAVAGKLAQAVAERLEQGREGRAA